METDNNKKSISSIIDCLIYGALTALEDFSVNHPNHLPADEKKKIEDVITCLFDSELDFINRYPKD